MKATLKNGIPDEKRTETQACHQRKRQVTRVVEPYGDTRPHLQLFMGLLVSRAGSSSARTSARVQDQPTPTDDTSQAGRPQRARPVWSLPPKPPVPRTRLSPTPPPPLKSPVPVLPRAQSQALLGREIVHCTPVILAQPSSAERGVRQHAAEHALADPVSSVAVMQVALPPVVLALQHPTSAAVASLVCQSCVAAVVPHRFRRGICHPSDVTLWHQLYHDHVRTLVKHSRLPCARARVKTCKGYVTCMPVPLPSTLPYASRARSSAGSAYEVYDAEDTMNPAETATQLTEHRHAPSKRRATVVGSIALIAHVVPPELGTVSFYACRGNPVRAGSRILDGGIQTRVSTGCLPAPVTEHMVPVRGAQQGALIFLPAPWRLFATFQFVGSTNSAPDPAPTPKTAPRPTPTHRHHATVVLASTVTCDKWAALKHTTSFVRSIKATCAE